ncbi:hypothetical protein JM18_002206 [Phytophthora kernoviae]|uniref:Aminotransferase class I/classII domain-containing protein n=2 Tax=Phytophthora kernoviae TaxID=325452 RepID=A0A8T0M302_9STRA|nr:hypothetical protein G195_002994 [Phytophthora kernoviae 00238/432]KAG2526244.1 hypothetical protein JM16_002102 [Phytophthora kernoviae]KAG2527803.1 hypothetical protein JM18_002206 [Phytophthora kernoviae]
MLTYLADVTAAFGTSPYVIVQKYIPGSNCDATRLSDSTAYLADGKCHKTDATASYAATRATDASATIKTYSDSDTCGTTGTTLTVTAAQATANLCLSGTFDVKLYGDGLEDSSSEEPQRDAQRVLLTPNLGFYIFIDLALIFERKAYMVDRSEVLHNVEDFCDYLIRETGVTVGPGSDYGERNGLRIAYAGSMDTLVHAVDGLEFALNSFTYKKSGNTKLSICAVAASSTLVKKTPPVILGSSYLKVFSIYKRPHMIVVKW